MSWCDPTQPASSACAMSPRCRTASCRNGSASCEDGKPAVLFNVYEQPDGNAVQIASAVQRQARRFQVCRAACSMRELVRPERTGDAIGRQRARCGADRPACSPRIVLILFLRNLARHPDRGAGGARNARRPPSCCCSVLGMSFNIMTLGRYRRGGRSADRRRHRHGRAHRASCRRTDGTAAVAGNAPSCRPARSSCAR